MKLFKNLFNADNSKGQNSGEGFNTMTKTDFESFQDLVELHAGLSFEKQLIFGDVIGSYSWNLDMQKGKIFFGPLEFPIQIIGSLAFGSQSWMWGWANTQSGMPENLLLQSHQLKNIGQQKNIKEFTEGHFNVEEGFEHKMGMMACGLFQAKSYYCANYGQGTLVVTIDDPEIPMVDLEKSEKVFTSFPQLIGAVDLNHKKTFLNYLIDRDFKLKVSENKIEAIRNNIMVMAEFDELDRLTALNGNT